MHTPQMQALLDEINALKEELHSQQEHINTLQAIGTALSSENDLNTLLQMILEEAKRFTNADGGTLYLMSKDERYLEFTVVQTDSLNIKMGGKEGDITWPPLALYKEDGSENQEMVAAMCALKGEPINIPDVYEAQGFNFEGTKKFDEGTGFRSKSMLVIPMKNYEGEVIGVCQLLNCQAEDGTVVPFSNISQASTLSLASQAAVAITNVQLINDLRELLEAFIKSIASAIDAKSPYTGGHVRKVAEIAMLMANEINADTKGRYKDVHYDYHALNQIRIAALMHDIGKITTPEYVMDKSTKLETIYDRIETIKTRFELYKRDKKIAYLEALSQATTQEQKRALKALYEEQIEQINADFDFIKEANIGGEFMSDDKIERINSIAKHTWHDGESMQPLLSENEVYNLNIRKGTLTDEEREQINFHATMSNRMLEALPFPKKLSQIPQIAGGHHEKLNGKGYPNGLTADELTLEARLMAIADIFEALTASDRPYKEAKKMSETMKILSFMVKDGDIDGDLLDFFYERNLHIKYAQKELKPFQLDVE